MKKWIQIFLIFLGCSSSGFASSKLKVVVSFSVLKDLVENIAGQKVSVDSLVGPNSDAHTFEPTSKSAQLISEADLIFINGLGFEGWMTRLLESTKTKAKVVVVSEGVKPRIFVTESDANPSFDPHTWHDVKNAIIYVNNIESALLELMPQETEFISRNASHYRQILKNLEAWIYKELKDIPLRQRTIITAHDAFEYLSEAYQIKFLSPQGLSTESEPSAQEVVSLIKNIKEHEVKVVFVENITNERLIRHIAEETGATIGGMLYSDALSEKDQPAATYVQMMKINIELLKSGMLKNKL